MRNWSIKIASGIVGLMSAVSVGLTYAQTEEFSTDYNTFVEQMDELFKTTPDKKKAKAFIAELQNYMNSGSPEIKDRMIGVCNRMRKLRGRPFPDYNNCISTFMAIDGSDRIKGNNYKVWDELMEDKLGRGASLNKINAYLKFTQDYISSAALNTTAAVRWKFDYKSGTRFINDDGKLVIEVPRTTLICISQNDSIMVNDTEGRFYAADAKWEGKEGKITWERCGMDPNSVNATFGEYHIDMKTNSVNVMGAEFVNKEYFDQKLMGSVEYKCLNRKTSQGNRYPRFETMGQRMEIKNIFKNIDYNGGFTQTGSSFVGSGSVWLPAEVNIYRHDTLFATISSATFLLNKEQIECSSAEVKLRLGNEEISHPGLRFRYRDKQREVQLTRGHKGVEQTLYRNSYHKVSMDVELMKWNLDSDQIVMTMLSGAAQNTALFESESYYREEYYNQLQGMDMTHPLQKIADFVRYNGGGGFPVKDYAEFTHTTLAETRMLLLQLSYGGFVDYYVERDVCRARPRLYDYLKFRLGQKDYDVIRFESLDSTGLTAS